MTYRTAYQQATNPRRRLPVDATPAQFRAGLVVFYTADTTQRLTITGRSWTGTTWRYSTRPVGGGPTKRYDEDELVLARAWFDPSR